jgi:ATP-grasp domain-containing protein
MPRGCSVKKGMRDAQLRRSGAREDIDMAAFLRPAWGAARSWCNLAGQRRGIVELKRSNLRVIITGARTPFALHLARLFHVEGHQVLLTDSQRFALGGFTRMKQRFVQTPSARFETRAFENAICKLIEDWQPDLIVPSCEEVFYLAALLVRTGRPELLFAPSLENLVRVHDKSGFATLAGQLGAGAGHNVKMTCRADVAEFAHDPANYVFKPVWSRFAARVMIGPNRQDIDQLAPTPADPWLAQSRISGEELSAYAIAWGGRIVATAVYRNLLRAGKGTGICYQATSAPDIEAFVGRFATETGWHGQVSFDFIRAENGQLVAIECNPRATSGLSLFSAGDGLVQAIIEGTQAAVPSRKQLAIKGTTMLAGVFGWLGLAPRQAWVKHFFRAEDALGFPGDGTLLWGQTLSVAELFVLSLRKKCTILEAATFDMDWNGFEAPDPANPNTPFLGPGPLGHPPLRAKK